LLFVSTQKFQNRYKSILCQENAYLKELVRYIHFNSLRAEVVKTRIPRSLLRGVFHLLKRE